MSRKLLHNEEMLHITGSWIEPQSPANIVLLSVPELAAKAPLIAKTHTTLAAAARPSTNPRIAEIIAEQSKLDLRHDSIIRGVFGLCTAMAELLGGHDGAELIALRDSLIPDGLSSMQKTYRAEAGQAMQLANHITPEIKTKAKAIHIGSRPQKQSLLAYLNEWITVGKRLGTLEDEKTQLLAEQSGAAAGTALVQARNRWIRVVNALLADADLAEIDAATDLTLFGPLRDAEKKAETRSRAAPADPQTSADPVPTGSSAQP
jgi:hypothetical protein